MEKLPPKFRVVAIPLVAFCGGVMAMVWPLGHATFCSGFASLGL